MLALRHARSLSHIKRQYPRVGLPKYRLYLHDGPVTRAESRYFDLPDQQDVLALAREALIEDESFSHAEVWTEEGVIVVFSRDSDSDSDRPQAGQSGDA